MMAIASEENYLKVVERRRNSQICLSVILAFTHTSLRRRKQSYLCTNDAAKLFNKLSIEVRRVKDEAIIYTLKQNNIVQLQHR